MDRSQIERDLKGLPLRAVVAFAARCARRVRPLFRSALSGVEDVERAVVAAELFASGAIVDPADAAANDATFAAKLAAQVAVAVSSAANNDAGKAAAEAAKAASEAATAAAMAALDGSSTKMAASNAASAAVSAAVYAAKANARGVNAAKVDIQTAMAADLDRLAALNIGEQETFGRPNDPAPTGPLGPLWPDGEPEWLRQTTLDAEAGPTEHIGDAPPLSLYFDIEEFSDAEIAEMIAMLSGLYRDVGGDGLVIDGMTLLEPAAVPEGA